MKTATSDPSSICEIGIGTFEDGLLIDSFRTYIDPECTFDPLYTENVHGITEEMVHGFFTFDDVYDIYGLREMLENKIVVHHSPLPRIALEKAIKKYDLDSFKILWLDSEIVAQNTWNEFTECDSTLENMASRLGIKIQYPDALQCSLAIGRIIIEASNKLGIGIDELVKRFYR